MLTRENSVDLLATGRVTSGPKAKTLCLSSGTQNRRSARQGEIRQIVCGELPCHSTREGFGRTARSVNGNE